jgi:GNAT superfamily N-acetyltransferase
MREQALKVVPVASGKDWQEFIHLPFRLYRGNPYWVPPLKKQVREYLDTRHPFYQGGRAERELFLAVRANRTVGRIAAILNRAHNEFHGDRWGFFGFFECEEDHQAAQDLLAAAGQWLRQRGCNELVGPTSPSTNYECGLLVEGFDEPPTVMMTYNPPYYPQLLQEAGLEKAKDLYAYWSPVHPGSLERLRRFSQRTQEREPELSVRPVNLKDFANEVRIIQDIYNKAWEKNWGFVPTSQEEFAWLAKELKPLVDPKLLYIAFFAGDPAGFLLALPDVNPALAQLKGSMANPLRLLRAWWVGRKLEGLRLITMGVKGEYRLRGIEGVMFYHGLQAALERGYRWCEYSWILEDNELAKRTVRLMDAQLKKIYRLYRQPL